jgi:diaminohydroxyphosphoribosylaminopyrimidine deaminase/5-amino-6-(5-phosphoribosylamino)uracil reductase
LLLFSDAASRVDDPHLSRALALAITARGATSPNPLVGAVVVRDGGIVGEGYHHRAGEPHAEVLAIREAGERAIGADLYVTLEPCSHTGRTPPCTEAIVAAGIRRVIVGMRDPNPQAAGGVESLRDAGVDVFICEDPAPFREVNRGWLTRLRLGRPFVTVKIGSSLDGKSALERDQRSMITGVSGAAVTRILRSGVQAVVVGASTAAIDDPALTCRDPLGVVVGRQPLRVVLTRGSALDPALCIFTDGAASTLVVAPADAARQLRETLPDTIEVEVNPRGEDLLGAFEILGARGVDEALVEAGPRLLAALHEAGLVDRLVVVTAGGMAGSDAPSLWHGPGHHQGPALLSGYRPAESGIVGDVIVNVWEPVAPGVEVEGKAY